ncbi:MAG: hypothetical protein EAX90_12850 [Candidatus Heimdallarchaeota archaeon]|nr:hypothetical protein [Candidatus Heimdallarchaeota archaeon]
MNKIPIAEDFTTGFNYSVKNGEMTLNFFCDCCGNEVKVSEPFLPNNNKDQNEVFANLKKDMDGKFHRCEKCGLLVCQKCWDNREKKCTECPICVTLEN